RSPAVARTRPGRNGESGMPAKRKGVSPKQAAERGDDHIGSRRTPADDDLLKEAEVARMARISPKTLGNWRWNAAGGPPFIRLSGRLIRYRRADVEAWLQRGTRASTSDTGGRR